MRLGSTSRLTQELWRISFCRGRHMQNRSFAQHDLPLLLPLLSCERALHGGYDCGHLGCAHPTPHKTNPVLCSIFRYAAQ